jgi:hypothetical protein
MGTIQEPTPGPRRRPDGELALDITRPNRQAIASSVKETETRQAHEAEERARERATEASRDRVDVSPAAERPARAAGGEISGQLRRVGDRLEHLAHRPRDFCVDVEFQFHDVIIL